MHKNLQFIKPLQIEAATEKRYVISLGKIIYGQFQRLQINANSKVIN